MNKKWISLLAVGLMVLANAADARDDRLKFPIADAKATDAAKEKLDGSIKFYWGKQKHPAVAKSLGEFTSNKKTNFFNKSDKDGCEWVWLSAMISLQERAQKEGGNAVIGIKSVYKNDEFVSETEYECGAGTFAGGVALRGEVVKLAK
jgi:hypothetical protein